MVTDVMRENSKADPAQNVCFVNVGCQKTNLDSLHVRRYCEANGWKAVSDPREASLICVGTCAVIESMEQRSKVLIETLIQKHPHARVVISGCLAAIRERRQIFSRSVEMVPADALQEWEKIVPPEKKGFAEVSGYDPSFTEKVIAFSETPWERAKRYLFDFGFSAGFLRAFQMLRSKWSRRGVEEKPAYLLEISKGCLEQCSYCTTRLARGILHSRPLCEILQEFSEAVRQGFKRFILIASDTGCYGLDIGRSFAELLEALFAVPCELEELMILDFNVKWLIKDYAVLAPILKRYQEKIVLSAMTQHVDDRLLALMKRGYNSDDMVRCLRKLREESPRLAIATNIIVGFPSESHEEFCQLVAFLKQIRFNKVLVYQYSARPGTAAAQLPGQISAWVKWCRMLRLEIVQVIINFCLGSEGLWRRIRNGR